MRHHHHRADYHHSRVHRRDAARAAAAAALLALILLAALFGISRWERQAYASGGGGTAAASHGQPDITWNGTVYTPKQQVEAYLLMGIDVTGPVTSRPGNYNGGQADAQFLLVLDNEAQTWQLLRLNRDSMVDVPVLDLRGDVIGYERQQLALAHAYGDGTNNSCRNTVDAVSRLLGGAPIDGYAALNMDGIALFNDAIGGVTVTITSDFTAVDPTLVEGETITLNGQQAFEFVRTRKDVDDQTNLARMERQRQFLAALEQKARTLDADLAARVWQALADYVVTDIPSGTAARAAQCLRDYTRLPLLTIAGENRVEDGYWAYYLDQDSLQQVILQLFYTEI